MPVPRMSTSWPGLSRLRGRSRFGAAKARLSRSEKHDAVLSGIAGSSPAMTPTEWQEQGLP
jgi:hypothetical protein